MWAPAWREMGPHQEDRLLRTRRRLCGEGLMRGTDEVHANCNRCPVGEEGEVLLKPPEFVRENVLFLLFSTLVSFFANPWESTSFFLSPRPHHLSPHLGSEAMFLTFTCSLLWGRAQGSLEQRQGLRCAFFVSPPTPPSWLSSAWAKEAWGSLNRPLWYNKKIIGTHTHFYLWFLPQSCLLYANERSQSGERALGNLDNLGMGAGSQKKKPQWHDQIGKILLLNNFYLWGREENLESQCYYQWPTI